jgi:hypothetical protein
VLYPLSYGGGTWSTLAHASVAAADAFPGAKIAASVVGGSVARGAITVKITAAGAERAILPHSAPLAGITADRRAVAVTAGTFEAGTMG